MRDAKDLLEQGTKELRLDIDVDKGMAYLELVQKWSRAKNLTAITALDEMVVKHLLDSLTISFYLNGDKILDVGSGGGFPGIPLAIAYPERHFTLLDSNGKKTRFLEQAAFQLKLSNVSVVQSRVEQYTPDELFSTITSRAFTSLANMLKLCRHLKARNGVYLAMKAKLEEDEQLVLNSLDHELIKLEVPFLAGERTLVKIS